MMSGSFFFQAEDGIRALYVTGVQTCALPICTRAAGTWAGHLPRQRRPAHVPAALVPCDPGRTPFRARDPDPAIRSVVVPARSEERRVGKESGSRAAPLVAERMAGNRAQVAHA